MGAGHGFLFSKKKLLHVVNEPVLQSGFAVLLGSFFIIVFATCLQR